MALDNHAAGAELAHQLGHAFQHVIDVRIVKPLVDLLAVDLTMRFLCRSQSLGEKWITTVLVRISGDSARILPTVLGAN